MNFNNKAILLPVVDPVPVRADKHIIVIIVNKAMRTNKSPIIIRHLFRRLVVQLFRVFLISIFLYWSRMRIGMLKCLYLLLIVIQWWFDMIRKYWWIVWRLFFSLHYRWNVWWSLLICWCRWIYVLLLIIYCWYLLELRGKVTDHSKCLAKSNYFIWSLRSSLLWTKMYIHRLMFLHWNKIMMSEKFNRMNLFFYNYILYKKKASFI